MSRSSKYEEKIQQFTGELQKLRQKLRIIGWGRLIVFALAAGGVYQFFSLDYVPWVLGVIGLAIFLVLVKRYANLQEKVRFTEALIQVNQEELDALNGNHQVFPSGRDLGPVDHPFAHDLDLFGEGSIFQWLNRTVTRDGTSRLASELIEPKLNVDTILEKQEAIQEVAPMVEFRQHFRALGMLNKADQKATSFLLDWVKNPSQIATGLFYKIALYVVPVYSLVSLVLLITGLVNEALYTTLFILPLALVGIHLRNTNRQYLVVSKMHDLILLYGKLLHLIESQSFESTVCKRWVEDLKEAEHTAGESIQELSKILSMLDQRNNFLVAILLNSWMLWDIRHIRNLQHWQNRHQDVLEKWIAVIARFDALNSLANMAYNRPEFNYPKPAADGPALNLTQAGHPLLDPAERIDNDFSLETLGFFTILTGANMAGKSTFLRTVGVSLVMAQCGVPICAQQMQFQPLQMFSSMRTTDSLQKHESYFFTELKRLKMIVDRLKNGERLFIILDEILKGTNSRDKEQGSKAFVRQLLTLDATGIIATHDLSLCTLEDEFPKRIRNQCFEVEMAGNDIEFDYKIRRGVCQNLNASFLMEQMGITPKSESTPSHD